MKKIFTWLLKHYSRNEKGRIEILRLLDGKISDNYREQTLYGNVSNYFIEFIMANNFVVKCATENNKESLQMLKSGIDKSFDDSINYIKKEEKIKNQHYNGNTTNSR